MRIDRPSKALSRGFVLALLGLLAACAAEDPAAPRVDLLLRARVGLEGVESAQVDAIAAVGRDLRPGAIGNLLVHFVDADSGEVLAHGRVDVRHEITAEDHGGDGISGEPLFAAVVTHQVRVPRPESGRGRVTFRWTTADGREVERAFRVEVPVEGLLPIVATEVDVVDDLGRGVSALSADIPAEPEGGVGRASSALHDGSDAPHCGNGELEENLYYIGGYVGYVGEYCDDGNTDDDDGCSSDCRHELTYVGGAPADSASLSVVFVPAGWGDLDRFVEYARFATEGTLWSDWYDENADKLSFWALDVEEVDEELNGLGCGDFGGASEGVADIRGAVMGGRYDGELRAHRPLQLVITTPSACRSYASFGGLVLLGNDERPEVLAHELGHSVGGLADEYSYGAEGRSCNGSRVNVANSEPVPWACLGGSTCPDGRPIHANTVGTGCPDTVTPCLDCMMRSARGDFCPVCYAQLDAVFADLLGSGASETCNGADDDLDGTSDEGCDCTSCTPTCGECGPDGCFGDCGTCGAGEGCRDAVCEAGCDSSCRTALGTDICPTEIGLFRCGGGNGYYCTCQTGGSIGSCTPCLPIDCTACATDEVCVGGSCASECPAGQTECNSECVDTNTDGLHCGGCNSPCTAGEACVGGTCQACSAGLVACREGCVDLRVDQSNCGACGRTCDAWEECRAGVCTGCSDTDPDVTVCGGACPRLDSDREHCGACGNACGEMQRCEGGSCVCEDDWTLCGSDCVHLEWDRQNCGACGNACGAGQDCRGGVCSDCGDRTLCDWGAYGWSFCEDLDTTDGHCGACRNACPEGQTCSGGVCG